MGFIKVFGLVVLAGILFIASLIAIVGLATSPLLHEEPYISALRDAGAFDYAEAQLAEVPSASFIKIPSGGVEELLTGLLGNTFSYLRSETDVLNLSVGIDQDKLRSFFLSSIERVPACAPGVEPDFDNLENICRKTGKSSNEILDELLEKRNLSFFESASVDLAGVYGLQEGSVGREKLDNIRNYLKIFYYTRAGVLALAAIIILIVFFVEKKNYIKTMRWTGIPILLAGSVFIGLTIFLKGYMEKYTLGLPIEILASLAESFIDQVINEFYMYSGIFLCAGVVLIVLSFMIRQKRE